MTVIADLRDAAAVVARLPLAAAAARRRTSGPAANSWP